MCGGELNLEDGMTVAECEYCGSQQTLPKLVSDNIANLYDRANHFRRNNDFDKAEGIYERILAETPEDSEAYWSLVLCRYGIEYVEDPTSGKRVPTVNRAQYTSIFDDENYKSAIEHSDAVQRRVYEEEAAAINEIQKGILAISQKEEPFDVFICYKETDANGRRTRDSVIANDLYHQLIKEGFKVFFSRITLEDKLGTAYEPYIFAALNSAKVMVVLGTKPEHFNAVWVKNEWSRYLALVKQSGGKKVLIPAYRDMDPYDLPEEFSHLQAQDMSKLGFMQDLIRGIKKITGADKPKVQPQVQTVAVNTVSAGAAEIAPLLKRMFMYLEDGEWDKADEYAERVLDKDPENAEAYVGKLMAELKVHRREDLKNQAKPFDGNKNYQKAVRFGSDKLKTELNGYIKTINDRNAEEKRKQEEEKRRQEEYRRNMREVWRKQEEEKRKQEELRKEEKRRKEEERKEKERKQEEERKEKIYNNAVNLLNSASSEDEYNDAANLFYSISGYKDADDLEKKCREKVSAFKKDSILAKAKSDIEKGTIDDYYTARLDLKAISGWKNADELTELCNKRIDEIETENRNIEKLKAKKKKKRIISIVAIGVSALAILIAFLIILNTVIIPNGKYDSALELYNSGKYEEAITAFDELDGYKDSNDKIKMCLTSIKDDKYNTALNLYNSGKFEEAKTAFEALNGYKDSKDKIKMCEDAIKDGKYNAALELYNSGKYEEALTAFKALDGYKDSKTKINELLFAINPYYVLADHLVTNNELTEADKTLYDGYGVIDKSGGVTTIIGVKSEDSISVDIVCSMDENNSLVTTVTLTKTTCTDCFEVHANISYSCIGYFEASKYTKGKAIKTQEIHPIRNSCSVDEIDRATANKALTDIAGNALIDLESYLEFSNLSLTLKDLGFTSYK